MRFIIIILCMLLLSFWAGIEWSSSWTWPQPETEHTITGGSK